MNHDFNTGLILLLIFFLNERLILFEGEVGRWLLGITTLLFMTLGVIKYVVPKQGESK